LVLGDLLLRKGREGELGGGRGKGPYSQQEKGGRERG